MWCGGEHGSLLKKYYFQDFLWKIACNGLYKRELALKVVFPKGLCFEDNYSAGMYLFFSKRVMMIKDILYYYRINLSGISKSSNKRLLDIAFVTKNLFEDLQKENYNDKHFLNRLANKFAIEVFHFIRLGKNKSFKIIQIDKSFYCWLCEHLNYRRRCLLFFYIIKHGLKVVWTVLFLAYLQFNK